MNILTTAITRSIGTALVFMIVLGLFANAQAQTFQQKQYAEHQKRLTAETKQRDDNIKRQQQNYEQSVQLADQQRKLLQRQQVPGGSSNRQAGTTLTATNENSSSPPPRPPATIQADKEIDALKIFEYADTWGKYYGHLYDKSSTQHLRMCQTGDFRTAAWFDRMDFGYECLLNEIRIVQAAELLAAYATTPKMKKEAAGVVYVVYEQFLGSSKDVRGCWTVGADELQLLDPDLAGVSDNIKNTIIQSLDKLESEFIVPRQKYWESKMQ